MPAETVTWLVVQNFKLKSPEAGPLLRRYCAMMRPLERVELGRFVLGAWLDQDLKRKYTDCEARALAKQQAPQTWQTYQQATQWFVKNGRTPPAAYQQTLQQVEDVLFQNLQRANADPPRPRKASWPWPARAATRQRWVPCRDTSRTGTVIRRSARH